MNNKPQKIAALGASDFFGMGDPEEGGYIGRFKKWYEMMDDHHFVYNLGIRAETSEQILKRLVPEAAPRKPDLLLLTGGSNDTRRVGSKDNPVLISIEDYKENIIKLIECGQALAQIIFISIHPFDESRTTPFAYWNKNNYYLLKDSIEYARISKEICESKQIPYLDIFNWWIKEDYFQWLHKDGQHANAIGHQMIFEKLKDLFLSLYSSEKVLC